MDATRLTPLTAEPAGPVRWEPCAEPRLDAGAATCTACGWPADDHVGEPPAAPARAA
jgi:hypothetical protein